MRFQRDRDRPLEADLVIVDEASMLDVVLAYDLLKALPPACHLVLTNAHRVNRGALPRLASPGAGADFFFVGWQAP
jgi:ATP-dependent exoDNAse (exonuclease V) alpha subunit